jgi:predicted GTPase
MRELNWAEEYGYEVDAKVDAKIEKVRKDWKAAKTCDQRSICLFDGLGLCGLYERPLPDWLLHALNDVLIERLPKKARTKLYDGLRWQVVDHEHSKRDKKTGKRQTLEMSCQRASEKLAGTPAGGGIDTMLRAYKAVRKSKKAPR